MMTTNNAQIGGTVGTFRGEYFFLSNFFPARICFDGITYFSAENAYQAQKCSDISDRKHFSEITADEAKRYWNKNTPRADWEQVKLPLMKAIVREKFTQNPYLAEFLAATGDIPLLEGNSWGDVFWGVSLKSGEGENHLGKILMELRKNFQTNGISVTSSTAVWDRCGLTDNISAIYGDITQSECRCIVSAADSIRLKKDDIDGTLRYATGKELAEACQALNGCAVGEAKLTSGFGLKADHIIHTVGPNYGVPDDELLLRQCYKNILTLAKENDIRSIAVPAISVGRASYPKKAAVRIAVEAVSEWLRDNDPYRITVEFVSNELSLYNAFCDVKIKT